MIENQMAAQAKKRIPYVITQKLQIEWNNEVCYSHRPSDDTGEI